MNARELERRVGDLEKRLADFSDQLRLALQYVQSDASSSLTKSRIVLERFLVGVYTAEMEKPPRRPLLGDMLADNQFTRKIERRILSRMNAIRDMANLGPHGEPVEPSDAARVLDDLCEVLSWYLSRGEPGGNEPKSGQGSAASRFDGDVDRGAGESHTVILTVGATKLSITFRGAMAVFGIGALLLAVWHLWDLRRFGDPEMRIFFGAFGAMWLIAAGMIFTMRRWALYASLTIGCIHLLTYLALLAISLFSVGAEMQFVFRILLPSAGLVAVAGIGPGYYAYSKLRSDNES